MQQALSSATSAARFFTRPSFRALSNGTIPSWSHLGLTLPQARGDTRALVGNAIDEAYALLRGTYRNEYIYKNEIVSRVVFGRHSPKTAGFCSELAVGDSIADVVVFNGTSTVYEIKTELDSLQRLPSQLADYLCAFDRVNVVTHEGAVDAVLRMAPAEVGVILLTKRGALSQIRAAVDNTRNIVPSVLFGCLRRSEYLEILQRTHAWNADVPSAYLVAEAKKLFCELRPEVAHAQAVLKMRKRTTDSARAQFVSQLPYGLRTLGLSQPLSAVARARLLSVLKQRAE
jgi:hypothetical protein